MEKQGGVFISQTECGEVYINMYTQSFPKFQPACMLRQGRACWIRDSCTLMSYNVVGCCAVMYRDVVLGRVVYSVACTMEM